MSEMTEAQGVGITDERVVLSKFEGDPVPENEFERVTVHNGEVIAHEVIEHGEPTGPVENSTILGKNIGYLTQEGGD